MSATSERNFTLEQLSDEAGVTPTTTVRTGSGGLHYFFRLPEVPIKNDTAGKLLGPGVDVLADGKYIVAPFGRHPSGRRYKWVTGKSIDETKPAALPSRWLEQVRADLLQSPIDGNSVEPSAEIDGLVQQGQRNAFLTSVAGRLRRAGLSNEAVVAGLLAENKAKCQPPFDRTEVEKIAGSVGRYPTPGSGGGLDPAEALARDVLNHQFAGGNHLKYGSDGRFWLYDARLWRTVQDVWVKGKILEVIEAQSDGGRRNTSALIQQAAAIVQAKLAVKDDQFSFVAEPPQVINCANGELWISENGNLDLRPHRPESNLRHCLPINYDPTASCPTFNKALSEIFGKARDPEAMVRHWHELTGYLIQPRRSIPIIVILLGGGDNSKTSLTRTVTRLLGESLVQAQSVEALLNSRFAMGSLFGKLLFVDDDVKAGIRLPDGMLKTMSEAKEVTGELKFKPPFNFVIRTVPILLCNNISSVADVSHGMLKRLMVIPFDRTFTENEIDRDLFKRIWANELPGILNRALDGLKRVVRRGYKFDYPKDVKRAADRFLRQANPLPAFIADLCKAEGSGRILLSDFYGRYEQWAQASGFTFVQQRTSVKNNLQHLGYTIKHGNKGLTVHGLKIK